MPVVFRAKHCVISSDGGVCLKKICKIQIIFVILQKISCHEKEHSVFLGFNDIVCRWLAGAALRVGQGLFLQPGGQPDCRFGD